MNKIRKYFIGDILKSTEDPFEQARAILILRLCIMFNILFIIPLISDIVLGYDKAVFLHGFAFLTLFCMPFIVKKQKNIEKSINLFFAISLCISFFIGMMLNPEAIEIIGFTWTIFFLVLSALIQRGKMRILFCCFLIWLPIIYVVVNGELKGALTLEWVRQKGAENPPLFLLLFPVLLIIYAVWTNSITAQNAKVTITEQKKQLDEKNKEVMDSIHYAKRIQVSLLPTEKYIERILKKKDKSKD